MSTLAWNDRLRASGIHLGISVAIAMLAALLVFLVWYPYPYPHMTVNEGVIGGGMESPMITIIGGGRTPEALYGVTSHGIAHMWWPMIAGSQPK